MKALLQHNAKVYLAARSADKANRAIEELKADTGKTAIFLPLDLADLRSVRKAADEFMSCVPPLMDAVCGWLNCSQERECPSRSFQQRVSDLGLQLRMISLTLSAEVLHCVP